MNTKDARGRTIITEVKQFRFAIAVSRFNETITKRLEEGAVACFLHHGVPEKHVSVFRCPGAFELPQVANKLLSTPRWDAVVCLGAVIRGETAHFEYVASEAARGIQDVALRHSRPVVFGVLTTENEQQALDRSGGKHGNKGWDAALAAMEMSGLFEELTRRRQARRK